MKDSLPNSVHRVKEKFASISPYLNERSRRIWAATEARSYGRGGISVVHQATGLSRVTMRKGLRELETDRPLSSGRIRKPGGGRKPLTVTQPELLHALEALVEPVTRGDPESPLRWTSKSTYKLAAELTQQDYQVGQRTVCQLLAALGYSLQANRKTREGASHPDRDAQFAYINEVVKNFQHRGQPVISVDTKKKEKIGNFKNPGQEYCPKGRPREVKVYDFLDNALGKVIPYGVYDLTQNTGWVSVGITHDTAQFAVESIRHWWYEMGRPVYPAAQEILVTADCGGSNGYRVRLWKVELQQLANELRVTLQVCHFPPGTSKWNKIEHKMFSYISQNWRGKPLLTRETVVNLIGNTTTKTGLEIQVRLDQRSYKKGIKISNEEFNQVNIEKADFHGEWNYRIHPQGRN